MDARDELVSVMLVTLIGGMTSKGGVFYHRILTRQEAIAQSLFGRGSEQERLPRFRGGSVCSLLRGLPVVFVLWMWGVVGDTGEKMREVALA